jgi:hypothetical protein
MAWAEVARTGSPTPCGVVFEKAEHFAANVEKDLRE